MEVDSEDNSKKIKELLKIEEASPSEGIEGVIIWRLADGKIHRIYGPAIEHSNGYMAWYKNGKRHRVDGPALIRENGRVEYWYKGRNLSKGEFNNLPCRQKAKKEAT